MNITMSTEELQSYQRRCEDWVERTLQKELFNHLLKGNPLGDFGGMMPNSMSQWLNDEIKKIDDYLLVNPIPKLIPSV